MSAKRIFSGIQPTGVPHIGNYLGAIKNWVRLQNASSKDDLVMFCVVDLHSCTTAHNTKELNSNIFNMVASLMACGIDPDRSLLFQQSQVQNGLSRMIESLFCVYTVIESLCWIYTAALY